MGRKEPLLFATGYLEHFASGGHKEVTDRTITLVVITHW